MTDRTKDRAPEPRPAAEPHPALEAIVRLAAGWHVARRLEDEPASFERTLQRLAGRDRS